MPVTEYCAVVEAPAEFRLKCHVVSQIMSWLNMRVQQRHHESAESIVQEAYGASDERKYEMYMEALEQDVLHDAAWFNLGILFAQGNEIKAVTCFAMAALLNRGDMEAWGNAFILAYQLSTPLADLIFHSAYHANEELFVGHLITMVRAALEGEDTTAIEERIADQREIAAEDRERAVTLRMPQGDTYEELVIGL